MPFFLQMIQLILKGDKKNIRLLLFPRFSLDPRPMATKIVPYIQKLNAKKLNFTFPPKKLFFVKMLFIGQHCYSVDGSCGRGEADVCDGLLLQTVLDRRTTSIQQHKVVQIRRSSSNHIKIERKSNLESLIGGGGNS